MIFIPGLPCHISLRLVPCVSIWPDLAARRTPRTPTGGPPCGVPPVAALLPLPSDVPSPVGAIHARQLHRRADLPYTYLGRCCQPVVVLCSFLCPRRLFASSSGFASTHLLRDLLRSCDTRSSPDKAPKYLLDPHHSFLTNHSSRHSLVIFKITGRSDLGS